MKTSEFIAVGGEDVKGLLQGREQQLIDVVGKAYMAHELGNSSLPHSSFLRFPNEDRNRIIALPAWLGDDADGVAGIKWIASFPENVSSGIDRASAVILLNSMATGQPTGVLEASTISAKRTAASAALGAAKIHGDQDATTVGLMGCGLINFEIARFLMAVFNKLDTFVVFDISRANAQMFGDKLRKEFPRITNVEVVDSPDALLRSSSLQSLATNAGTPHIRDISMCPTGSTLLHISLRDLSVPAMRSADHVVDDVDHVNREKTSIHLTSQELDGDTSFVRSTIGEILLEQKPARRSASETVVYSPFGLGVLDMALASLVMELAREKGVGQQITDFLPAPWRPQT